MVRNEIDARENIMAAAMKLIEEHGDASRITVRDIAARAGVGVGLVNYHFQTKENLIDLCVQRIIGEVIVGFEPMYKGLELEPLDKLRFLLKSTASFLVSNPGLSRISIIHDIISGNTEDNSIQTAKAYYPVVREVCGEGVPDALVRVKLHTLISSVQVAFLRSGILEDSLGFDFHDAGKRNEFIDLVVDGLFWV